MYAIGYLLTYQENTLTDMHTDRPELSVMNQKMILESIKDLN